MLKILLVEDDEILSDSILEILAEIGDIVQVYDGEEACTKASGEFMT